MDRTRVVIMGAAGRDFHDFGVVFRAGRSTEVVAFTAAQIPGIADRRYPPGLAGPLYDHGIPLLPENEFEEPDPQPVLRFVNAAGEREALAAFERTMAARRMRISTDACRRPRQAVTAPP